MRAILVEPPHPGARWGEVPEPAVHRGEVLVRVLEGGVCGTDRDIASGAYGTPPAGRTSLVLGHENLGVVERVGPGVSGWARGELAVATVRRGCGACRFCLTNQSDLCETGRFTERGIRGRDGFFAERYVEQPEYLVKVPSSLRPCAVLLEPLSVVEKAVAEGTAVLRRLGPTPGYPRNEVPRALVGGTGAIGMLASLLLVAEGYRVTAIDRHDDTTPAARLLERIGAEHRDVSRGLAALAEAPYDLIVEATGSATVDLDLARCLGPNGALVLTGIPAAGGPPVAVDAGGVFRSIVLGNQAIVGSVNANRSYFERGIAHLKEFRRRWGDAVERVITERRPSAEVDAVLSGRLAGGMKTVLTFATE